MMNLRKNLIMVLDTVATLGMVSPAFAVDADDPNFDGESVAPADSSATPVEAESSNPEDTNSLESRPPIVPPGSSDTTNCALGDYWCVSPERTWYPVWTEKGWDYQKRTPEGEKRRQEVIAEDYALSQSRAKTYRFSPEEYRFLRRTMSPQENSYYCGSAAVQAALRNENKDYNQSQIAGWLGTTSHAGTGWSDETRTSPVAKVMNAHSKFSYTAYPTPYGHGGHSAHIDALVIRTVDDINQNKPLLSNIWKKAGLDFNAMPKKEDIFHWIEIYGYMEYGRAIHFADPAGKSAYVRWGKWADPYSYTGASKLSELHAGRGYIA